MQTFSSTFGEEALLLDGFLQDIDSHNHTINPSCLENIRASNLHLHGALWTT